MSFIKNISKTLFRDPTKVATNVRGLSLTIDPSVQAEMIQVPLGEIEWRAMGYGYQLELKTALYRQYGDSPMLFSLTSQNQYQINHQWPEMPFVNINLAGSKITTKANWLGYIRTGYFGEPDLPAILKAHGGAVLMYGRLVKSHPDFNIYLLLPKSLDPFEASVTFTSDDTVDRIAEKIPSKSLEGSVLVTLHDVTTTKGDTYAVRYGDIPIGNLSFKKAKELKEWLNGRKIITVRMGIVGIRDGERPRYSKIMVTPDIV